MRRLALAAAVAGVLAFPSVASAGGMGAWALKGPSAGIQAGEVWLAQVRVVSCQGQLDGSMTPSVVLIDNASGRSVSVRARATRAPGKYTARVVFPSAGSWSYRVDVAGLNGQAVGPFRVEPAAKRARTPDRLLAALPPVGGALLVLGTGLVLRRRRA